MFALRAVGCLGVVLIGVVLPKGMAFNAYRLAAAEQLALLPTRVTCQYCHVNEAGGSPWNSFGQLVQNKLTDNIQAALFAALQANKDSDSDGYADVLEVFAGSLPGDQNSAPLTRVEALKTNFEKAGGFELYRPR
jgi:hypothetical protein